jgi:hypothetical protein
MSVLPPLGLLALGVTLGGLGYKQVNYTRNNPNLFITHEGDGREWTEEEG